MRLVLLAWVDGVPEIGKTGIPRVWRKYGNESGNVREAVVADAEQSDAVVARAK